MHVSVFKYLGEWRARIRGGRKTVTISISEEDASVVRRIIEKNRSLADDAANIHCGKRKDEKE